MIKFGPSGTCSQFAANGFTATVQAAPWLKSLGLDCFEYSFGRGVRVGAETAEKIGAVFAEKPHQLAAPERQIHVVKRLLVSIALENLIDFQHCSPSLNALPSIARIPTRPPQASAPAWRRRI